MQEKTTAGRYRQLSDAFTRTLESVPVRAWSRPSPCEGWIAEDVLEHVNGTTLGFLRTAGFADSGSTPGSSALDEWRRLRDGVIAALEDVELAAAPVRMGEDSRPFESVVSRFLCPDLLVHGWDIARATGTEQHSDPRIVAEMLPEIEQLAPTGRRMGAFGDEVSVPDEADELTKLLALTGRRV